MSTKQFFCKNDALFIELLGKGLDRTATEKEVTQVKLAVQAFMQAPQKQMTAAIQAMKAKLQAASVSTDFVRMFSSAFNVTMDALYFDNGWEAAFREVPRDEGKDFWEIATAHKSITFRRIPEGQRIRLEEISGDKVYGYVDYYGGGLGFSDRMIRFRQLAIMYDRASAFRNAFYTNKADNHYALLAAAAALLVVAWQGGAGDTTIQRDVLTINQAAFQLGNLNKDKGYGDTATMPLIIYANPVDEARIESAMRVTTDYLTAGNQRGTAVGRRPIQRVYTFNQFVVGGSPIMVLPGNKLQRNEAMAPTSYEAPQDILTLNRMQSVWSIYGAAVADTDQVLQFTLG